MLAFALIVLPGGFETARALAASGARVSYADDALTIEAIAVPGRELLVEIAREAGFLLRAAGANLERPVTLSLKGVPVDRGVRAVLRQIGFPSYALLYEFDTHQLAALVVLGDGNALGATTALAAPVQPVEATVVKATVRPSAPASTDQVDHRARLRERRARLRERNSLQGLIEQFSEMRASNDGEGSASLRAEE